MVVGALASTSKKLKNCIEKMGVVISIKLQKSAQLGTAFILRKVLDYGYVLWKQVWGRGGSCVIGKEIVPKTGKE